MSHHTYLVLFCYDFTRLHQLFLARLDTMFWLASSTFAFEEFAGLSLPVDLSIMLSNGLGWAYPAVQVHA